MTPHGMNFDTPQRKFTGALIPTLPSCSHTAGALVDLGVRMHSIRSRPPGQFPAGMTFFGQFVDHDITRNSASAAVANPVVGSHAGENMVTPALDLSGLYEAGGIAEQPAVDPQSGKFRLSTAEGPSDWKDNLYDLPRGTDGADKGKALIPDDRNDSSLLIAQLQVQFLRLHNYVIEQNGVTDAERGFALAREQVIACYRRIVRHDFLWRLLHKPVYEAFFEQADPFDFLGMKGPLFYPQDGTLPNELTGAAFRFGHALIKNSYQINGASKLDLLALFDWTGRGALKSKGLPGRLIVDWRSLLDLTLLGKVQMALSPSPAIGFTIPGMPWPASQLAIRNLLRGQSMGLPSGQKVTQMLCDKSGPMQQIISAYGTVKTNPPVLFAGSNSNQPEPLLNGLLAHSGLEQDSPLWYYLLCEANAAHGNYSKLLGPVASYIIAESFYHLLKDEDEARGSDPLSSISTLSEMIKLTQN